VGLFGVLLAGLLFTKLGQHPLWDDEANTALFGQSVWKTGVPSALVSENVIAYRGGAELAELVNRYMPPLAYYVEAPFSGLGGNRPAWARVPFAFLGWLTGVGVMAWLAKREVAGQTLVLMALGMLGNVSFLLFCRQCRYYSLAMFLSFCVVYAYAERDRGSRRALGLAVAAAALLFTQTLAYAALGGALVVDYVLFGRKERAYPAPVLLLVAATQVVALGAAFLFVRPTLHASTAEAHSVFSRATLLYWSIRDTNACEFWPFLVVAAAPLVYVWTRRTDLWLVRIPLGLLVYCVGVALVSPQPTGHTSEADVRYLSAAIPAAVFLCVRVLRILPTQRPWLRWGLALVLFHTNVANAAAARLMPKSPHPPLRCTLLAYLGELRQPSASAYGAVAAWLEAHVPPGRTLYFFPEFTSYPFMFSEPRYRYAWQLPAERRSAFPTLASFNFKLVEYPDYVVAFGPAARKFEELSRTFDPDRAEYRRLATLPVYFYERTRPELMWHAFTEVPPASEDEQIFVFQQARSSEAEVGVLPDRSAIPGARGAGESAPRSLNYPESSR
jgi:hypothetical protein